MMAELGETSDLAQKIPLKLAIVGGGRTCRFFLELLKLESFAYLKIRVVGVCDINPEAEGFRMARELGIYTTTNFRDLVAIEDLDGIIELTNSRDVLMELIRIRPKRVGILEHNIGNLLRRFFTVDQRLKTAEQQILFDRMVADFLIQQAKQRIVVLNPDFTVVDINDAFLTSLGKQRQDVLGQPCFRIIRETEAPCSSDQPGIECPFLETMRTGRSAHVIMEDPGEFNRVTYSEVVTCPVRNAEGETVRVIEIWRDVTEELSSRWEMRMEAVKSDINKLVQEDRLISLGKLVASCVHEINNPIQGLLTFSNLLQSGLSQECVGPEELEKMKTFATMMSGELERVGEIVSGLLSFSRETAMAFGDVNLNDILNNVVSLTRHRMELQDIQLHMDLCGCLTIVHGDSSRLQQCFLNLIFNAIEAMPSGGEMFVHTRIEPGGDTIAVEVRDTGYGIASDQIEHIFDPFFTTKNMGEGTGLGLSIVYGIVKNHSGDIQVRSEVGQGTLFLLEFPLKKG
jgi:two-component system NtrC family sensor kinase